MISPLFLPARLVLGASRTIAAIFCVAVMTGSASGAHKAIAFDAPGAQLTLAIAINDAGQVAGTFGYAGELTSPYSHGFLREPSGEITTFEVAADQDSMFVTGINKYGQIAGYYVVGSQSYGFIRDPDGTVAIFSVPAADDGTFVWGINDSGEVSGSYNLGGSEFGFVRNRQGTLTPFGSPTTFTAVAEAINASGTVAGYYSTGPTEHAFIRNRSTLVSFDAAASAATVPKAMNRPGQIAGYYYFPNNGELGFHGFLRNVDGAITSFDAPEAGTSATTGTFTWAMNDSGAITGYVITKYITNRGFVRDSLGNAETFNVLNASKNAYKGTWAYSINAAGTVTGFFIDDAGLWHGFIRF